MRVLIVGGKGQLGWALQRHARTAQFVADGVDLPAVDLTDHPAIREILTRANHDVVVNAAAYTAVDRAEHEADVAFAVNRDGVAHLAAACAEREMPLIHVSTDHVFNGKARRPYRPEDPIDPLSVYGKSKAAGEGQVRDRSERHVIIRTSWLYGVHGDNFVKTMIGLARHRDEVRVVKDQRGCPTHADDLAGAIVRILTLLAQGGAVPWGTYHYCNEGVTSWYEFAARAIALAGDHERLATRVVPITTAEYPTPAPRPAYAALDCETFASTFGVAMVPWKASLQKMIEALYGPTR